MYAIYFALFWTAIREMFQKIDTIWLSELPNVDRIHKMCLDLYVCREFGELDLETLIFQKLAFILRSSEISVTTTRGPLGQYDGRFILMQ